VFQLKNLLPFKIHLIKNMTKQPTYETDAKPIFWYASDSGIVPDTNNTGYPVACAFLIIIVSILLFFGLWAAFPLSVLTCGLITSGFVTVSAGIGYLFRPVNGGAATYDILPISIPMRPLTVP
jgi:hypothetical protein